MPKERIWDDAGMFDLEVGWTATGEYVQVGIITHDGRSLADWLSEKDAPAAPTVPAGASITTSGDFTLLNTAGGNQYLVPGAQQQSSLANFNSLWSTLSRAQINRLIRMLRKARDESYGKDE